MLKRGMRRVREFMLPMTGGLRSVNMEAVLEGAKDLEIRLSEWDRDYGAGSMWDLMASCAIARKWQPKVCFEIGTGHGRTTHHLALNTPEDTQIFTLDLSTGEWVGSLFRDRPTARKITQLTGDSSTFDFGPWAGRVDLVVVDGCHEYQPVLNDSDRAFEMLAPGGCILWDDFSPDWPGVIRALREHANTRKLRRLVGTKWAIHLPGLS